jgi:hypothetical protein
MTVGVGRESSARRPPPRRGIHFGFAAAEASEPPCAFPFYQRLERLADKARLLFQASEGLRFGHKFVVERQCRAHRPAFILGKDTVSDDADSNAAVDRFNIASKRASGAAPRSRRVACILWPRFERAIEVME